MVHRRRTADQRLVKQVFLEEETDAKMLVHAT